MYNNEVTYAKCWQTDRAKKFHKKLRTYLNRSQCGSDCPDGWAEEMYNFLKDIDKKFGIGYAVDSNMGFYWQGKALDNMFIEPFRRFFKKYEPPKNEWMLKYEPTTVWGHLYKRFRDAKHVFRYGFRQLYMTTYRQLYNKIVKPQVYLGQVKEKYGTIRVYFNTNDRAIDKYIEHKMDEMEFRLAQKGCYFPLVNMMGWSSSFSTSYKDHGYSVEPNGDGSYEVTKYTYRIIARDLLPREEYDKLMLEYSEKEAREKEEENASGTSVDSSVELNKHGKETK